MSPIVEITSITLSQKPGFLRPLLWWSTTSTIAVTAFSAARSFLSRASYQAWWALCRAALAVCAASSAFEASALALVTSSPVAVPAAVWAVVAAMRAASASLCLSLIRVMALSASSFASRSSDAYALRAAAVVE